MLRKTEPLYLQIFRSSLEISDEVLEIVCYLKRDKIYLRVKFNSNAQ